MTTPEMGNLPEWALLALPNQGDFTLDTELTCTLSVSKSLKTPLASGGFEGLDFFPVWAPA